MLIRFLVYMLSLELSEQPAQALAANGSQAATIDPAAQPAVSSAAIQGGIDAKSEAEGFPATEINAVDAIVPQDQFTHRDLGHGPVSEQPDPVQPETAQSVSGQLNSAKFNSVQSRDAKPKALKSSSTRGSGTAQARHARVERRWRPSTRRLIVLACIVLGMRIFIGEASVVPTASMEGTILVGDHLFMDKLLYGPEIPLVGWRLPTIKHIHRGDIIVFRYPKDLSETFLKRVAAVGGDRVEIRDSVLYVNSQPIQEPYAVHQAPIHSPLESWGPVVVPQGRLFVMGDNRDNSSDSRDWGFVPLGNVIGAPMFVYWSYDAPTSRWLDENLGHKINFYASIAENFFSRTRWSRTGTLL